MTGGRGWPSSDHGGASAPASPHDPHRHAGSAVPPPPPPPPYSSTAAADGHLHSPHHSHRSTGYTPAEPSAPPYPSPHVHPPSAPAPVPAPPAAPSAAATAGGSGLPPGAVYVTAPRLEVQPWAKNLWRWLGENTTGVARVDLRRPTVPLPEQYDGNLLYVRQRKQRGATAYDTGQGRRGGRGAAAPATPPLFGSVDDPRWAAVPRPTGARIKITRSFLVGAPKRRGAADSADASSSSSSDEPADGVAIISAAPGAVPPSALQQQQQQHPLRKLASFMRRSAWDEKPLLDFGIGVNLNMDEQRIQPVARLKIKDLVSIKAAPMGVLKISRSIPLGPVALKVRYELPLSHADRFWEPPARLLVRLDNAAGHPFHLMPGGVEFDEQVVRFGDAVTLRASAGLTFPRQLPIDEGDGPPFKLQIHRLSLKSIW